MRATRPGRVAPDGRDIMLGMADAPFSIAARARSFVYAFRGVGTLISSQHNAWIHALATIAVLSAGFVLGVSPGEWALLVLAIALVWAAEALNTAVELLCDAVSSEPHALIGRSKDVAAGGVLLAAIGAAIVGAIVFLPHLVAWLRDAASA